MFDPRQKPEYGTYDLDQNHPLSRGLAGLWLFNEGGGSPVDAVNGVVAGASYFPSSIKASYGVSPNGSGLAFPNTSPIVADLHIAGNIGGTYTLHATGTRRGTGVQQAILDRDDEHSDRIFQFRFNTSDGIDFIPFDTSGTPYFPTSGAVPMGKFTATATAGRGLAKVYVNGNVSAGVSVSNPFAPISNFILAGLHAGSLDPNPFNGILHTAALYRRDLNANEVAWLTNEPYSMLRSRRRRTYSIPNLFFRRTLNPRTGTRTARAA